MSALARLGKGFSLRHYGQHAAAVGFIAVPVSVPTGAGVIDGGVRHVVQAADGVPGMG